MKINLFFFNFFLFLFIKVNSINRVNFKHLFSKYYSNNQKQFEIDLIKRLKWSYLDLLDDKTVFRYDWVNYSQYDSLGPIIQCPKEILNVYGEGDEEKRICGQLDSEDCVVISLGSNNQWGFELDLIKKQPKCKVHTFDCFTPGTVPKSIEKSVTSYKICIGPKDEIVGGHEFMTWNSIIRKIGINHAPNALKMDIEGFEYLVIREMMKSSPHLLPHSISFEIHSRSSERTVPWQSRDRSSGEIGLFLDYLMRFGYILVDRRDNQFCKSCSEIVVARIGEYMIQRPSHHSIEEKITE